MATGRCEACGADEYMPYVCKFCRGRYCAAHRLPENHQCNGLGEYRERVRREGRMMAPEAEPVAAKVSAGARARGKVDELIEKMDGRATQVFLGAMVGVTVLQFIFYMIGLGPVADALFVLDRNVWWQPWTVLTSIFAHGGFYHLFFNALILFFFGPATENIMGTRRFTYLFLGGGAAAGLAQLLVFHVALPEMGVFNPAMSAALAQQGIVGASGAIMALLGCLTLLAPKMKVLIFFVIPAPLWAITAFYAVADLLGAFNPGSGVAHLAHLAGLAIGLWYGKKLADQGLRVRTGAAQGMSHRRHF